MARDEALYNAIIQGNRDQVQSTLKTQLDGCAEAKVLLMDSMIPAMREMGDRFGRNEVFIPEILIAARAMQAGLNILDPILSQTGHKAPAKVCIGTVKGDLHDIGKNLVSMMVRGAGFEVVDLGVDCDIDKISQAVADGAQAILLSALLTTTMPYMRRIVEAFKDQNVKVIIGGAPVTQEYADEIGAQGYAQDAGAAVKTLEQVLAA
jgi:5-methyltetrahydrofolate--homocysteine methyltransferase